jgi:hypothetical protein
MTDIEKAMKEAHKFADKALARSDNKLQTLRDNITECMGQPFVTTRAYAVFVVVLSLILGAWLG